MDRSSYFFQMTPLIKSSAFHRKGKNQAAGSWFSPLVSFNKKFLTVTGVTLNRAYLLGGSDPNCRHGARKERTSFRKAYLRPLFSFMPIATL